MPDKYEVTKGKDGGDRIRCGRRNLNVSDFLTQELHLPWRDAAPILQQTYADQIGHAAPQQARPALRRDLWADTAANGNHSSASAGNRIGRSRRSASRSAAPSCAANTWPSAGPFRTTGL